MNEAEIHHISRKYESFRLRDTNREKYLLQSILEHGILKPLQCVQAEDRHFRYVLLDGFKRLRCCSKLKLCTVPVILLGTDEAGCILHLLRGSNERNLTTLEQARFVDELYSRYGLSVSEIAEALECSKAWVSVRLGMIDEMSEIVQEAVFSDRLPLRSYMYTLRQFTRVNSIPATTIDRFVTAVTGKGLSSRDIDRLAYGYFRGGQRLKDQIEKGNLQWTLRQMKTVEPSHGAGQQLSEAEWTVVRDLELAQKYLSRLQYGLSRVDLHSRAFHAQASLLAEGLLGMFNTVTAHLKELL
jgi:ParB/RepB/Spo0J family partition protein